VTVASVSSIVVAPRMPVQNEKCRNKRGDSKAEKVRAGGKLIAVARARITEAGREAIAAEGWRTYRDGPERDRLASQNSSYRIRRAT
jgi:hypothetical protein